MQDYLVRGTVASLPIRVFACTTTCLVERARELHDLWPTASAALGRMMSCVLMMAAMDKNNEKLTVTINGGGPIGTMLCVTRGNGEIKGFVGDPHCMYMNEKTGKLAVGYAVGQNGYLQVIKDMGLKEPFVSQIPLQSGEIGDDFTMYFAASEQIPSAVSVGVLVGENNEILSSGGFIVQMLPGAKEEDIAYVENTLKDFPAVSQLIKDGLTPEEILHQLMPEVVILGERQPLHYVCDCSKEHFKEALLTLGKDEIKDMLETDGYCEISCQFCNRHYRFEREDLEDLLKQLEA